MIHVSIVQIMICLITKTHQWIMFKFIMFVSTALLFAVFLTLQHNLIGIIYEWAATLKQRTAFKFAKFQEN